MSSVAVLTQEIFNEHRSGLLPEQSNGCYLDIILYLYTHAHTFWFNSFYFLNAAAMAGTSAGEEEDALPTYKEAFPPLPEKAASPEGTQETANAWTSKIRPLKSSVITQVCHFEELNPVLIADVGSVLLYLQALVAKCFCPESLDVQKAFSLLNTDRESMLQSWLRCGFGSSCKASTDA